MHGLSLINGRLQFQTNLPQPKPQADEALVRVHLAGICATDLEMVRGYVPEFQGVLGHEFVGEVVSVPDVSWHGRRVVCSINIGCGTCPLCLKSEPEHCPTRQVLGIHDRDGVFAEYVAVPLKNLHIVPDSIPDEGAAFTEPLAAAIRIREQVLVRPTAKTAVIGPGRLGLLVGRVLALAGTEVTMLGRRTASLELPAKWGLHTGLAADWPDNSFDLVVEVTGNEAGFAQALRLVRPRGTLILKSTFTGTSRLDLTKLVVAEINVVGSRCGPFAPALRLLEANAVDVYSLIDAEFPLDDGLNAFKFAASKGVKKVLLRP
ncbi:MAG: alcohol dehydrogenase catalytic domain-containing protein [Chloroflexi bacterium]|nr:alcohol dehydrogenase catalytic domain-containing protein [Chloroflexota bacterium]